MTGLDWLILSLFLLLLIGVGVLCRRYMKSVSDWLVAGGGVRRYLGIVADAGEAMSLITIVASKCFDCCDGVIRKQLTRAMMGIYGRNQPKGTL